MKKNKCLLLGTAVLFAFGSALATKTTCYDCTFAPQYYYNGTTYVPAGQYGYDYVCLNFPDICTYYQPDPFLHPDLYVSCRQGRIDFGD